jgi:hypothetical protein
LLVYDTNVLIDAANRSSPHHLTCRETLDRARRDPSPTFLTWNVCYEFLRVTTHPRVLPAPWRPDDALRFIRELLAGPGFEVLVATDRHEAVLEQTLGELPALRGNLCHDLHTAVLMREHGISRICTRDTDFARFPFLVTVEPRTA